VKTQIIADVETQEIICTAQEKGEVHDFKLFKMTVRAIVWGILFVGGQWLSRIIGFTQKQSDTL
jgi:hypothetical protein